MISSFNRFLARLRLQNSIIWEGHILNPIWKSRMDRRKQREDVCQKAAFLYLEQYVPEISRLKPETTDLTPETERAFTIWFQGEEQAPPLVKACFRSMRRHLKQELVVLDSESIFNWITLPDYIIKKWKSGKISNAHFSDICRVELLYRHGGVWVDATDFVTSAIPQSIMDEDFFMFTSGETIPGHHAGFQNCFIRSKKGNRMLGIWREAIHLYWKNENRKINYYVHQMLMLVCVRNNEIAARGFEQMAHLVQDPTHVLWWNHYREKYDPELFERFTKDTFFQKTSYKTKGISDLPEDSIGAYMINS